MLSSTGDGHDVMHLLHGSEPSFSQTPFADGMALGIAVTDALPCPAILLVVVRGAGVLVILSCYELLVFLAVLTAIDRQPWAAARRASPSWFSRHTHLPPWG